MVGSFFEPGDWDKGQVCWSRATHVQPLVVRLVKMVVTLVIAQSDFEAKVWDASFIHQILTGQGKTPGSSTNPKALRHCAAQDLSYHCQRLHFYSRLCPFQADFDDKLTTKIHQTHQPSSLVDQKNYAWDRNEH